MKIAIVAPSSVPFAIGGAETLWWGLLEHLNQETPHRAELIKVPSPEGSFWQVLESYRNFSRLDLNHFDVVVSTKYPAWMVAHPRHVVYMQHRLRGLYDTYALTGLPQTARVDDPALASLREFMALHEGRRDALVEFFDRIAELSARRDELREHTRFPGPLIRECVHFLDGIGLAPTEIAHWAAISRNVTSRSGYFPPGVEPLVIHHPSNLRHLRGADERHLFTIARLDTSKRIELLVRAMRHVRAPVPLRIAGTGPEEENLRRLAEGDRRIEFLGFVSDRDAERLYADALEVPYVPYDEDYGLVTIEAMACGKPVITTTDAGGPNEFVEPGVTGLCVEPDPRRLADAIDLLCGDLDRARTLGLAGRERVRGITWNGVSEGLLGEPSGATPRRRTSAFRGRLAVATTFPVHPAEHGGQIRLFELLRRLAERFDVEVVALGRPGESRRRDELAPGLVEVCVPPSDAHLRAEAAVSRSLEWLPVTDVALPALYKLSPRWLEALEMAVRRAHGAIVSHPFTWPALESVSPGIPFFYDAQDVELDLKGRALAGSEAGQRLLENVRQVEESCCRTSSLVFVCSSEDGARFGDLYGLARERSVVVPNGVDARAVNYVGPEQRLERKRALGLGDVPTGIFIGSWHPPNIEAVRSLSSVADRCPEMRFLVLGGAGNALADESLAANLGRLGVVDVETKEIVLGISDLALNPMSWGSGTNLKMLEYCAAGIPVLTTEFGARGLTLRDGEHVWIAPLEDFPQALRGILDDRREAQRRAESARVWVERHYDWDVIAEGLVEAIESALRPSLGEVRGRR